MPYKKLKNVNALERIYKKHGEALAVKKKKNVIRILTLDGIQGNLINENSTSLQLKCIKCSLSSVAEPAPAPNF